MHVLLAPFDLSQILLAPAIFWSEIDSHEHYLNSVEVAQDQ